MCGGGNFNFDGTYVLGGIQRHNVTRCQKYVQTMRGVQGLTGHKENAV